MLVELVANGRRQWNRITNLQAEASLKYVHWGIQATVVGTHVFWNAVHGARPQSPWLPCCTSPSAEVKNSQWLWAWNSFL